MFLSGIYALILGIVVLIGFQFSRSESYDLMPLFVAAILSVAYGLVVILLYGFIYLVGKVL